MACGYLANNGYKIITRNARTKFGELDIVAKSPDKTLVFIEVKTINKIRLPDSVNPATYTQVDGTDVDKLGTNSPVDFKPEDHMNRGKINRFRKISEYYANSNPELIKKNGYRLDLIAIEIYKDGESEIRHYRNVV